MIIIIGVLRLLVRLRIVFSNRKLIRSRTISESASSGLIGSSIMIAPWNTLALAPICSSIPFISSSNVRLSAVSEPLIGSSSSTLPAPKPVTWPCVETAYISPPAAVRQRLLEAFSFSSLDCGNSSLYKLSCIIDLTVSELSATSTSE